MTRAEQVKVKIYFILNDSVCRQHEIKQNSSFLPCSILGEPNQKNPKWQTIINPRLLSSPWSNRVWITPKETAKLPTPRTPRHRNNHLLIPHLQQTDYRCITCSRELMKSLFLCFENTSQIHLEILHLNPLTSVPHALFSKQKSLTSHLHLDVWIGEVQNNIRLQLWKALCLLEMDATTEQNGGWEQGKKRERPTDTEAAGGTLMQSISAATCGYEAQSYMRACPVQQMNTNPTSPPPTLDSPLQHLYHPPLHSPTSLSLCNQWREPIHVSYLTARGATGWNATPCMGETRGGKRS